MGLRYRGLLVRCYGGAYQNRTCAGTRTALFFLILLYPYLFLPIFYFSSLLWFFFTLSSLCPPFLLLLGPSLFFLQLLLEIYSTDTDHFCNDR